MATPRQLMAAAGIAYAGIDGTWWLPAAEPFTLPAAVADELTDAAGAIFALLDAVDALYATPEGAACGLDTLLEHKVPSAIPRRFVRAPVLGLRPDFQIAPDGDGYRLAATELEIAPSAQGFAHAMQVGYGLPPNLAHTYASWLAGRELLVICAGAWCEFLFDQLAFCRALAAAGARARVLCDTPVGRLDDEIRRGLRWRPPMFGVREPPLGWDPRLVARIGSLGLAPFLGPPPAAWPVSVGDAVVFRFGYFDCLTPAALGRLAQWAAAGATFLNPPAFYLDSKAVLAAAQLPVVRARVAASPGALAALERCIPETVLLREETAAQVLAGREGWVLKFAAYDQGGAAWGGRSLQVGAEHSADSWAAVVRAYLALPWPVVAQRTVASATLALDYLDEQGLRRPLRGNSRLRAFLLRGAVPAVVGTHLTVSGGAGVAEATDAVQAPIRFTPAYHPA